MKLIAALLIAFATTADACDFLDKHPHQTQVQLANGASVPLPTHGYDLDTYIVHAWMDYEKTAQLLAPHDLYPVKIGGKALGAIGVLDYKKSDMGSFKESYFVILTTPKEDLGSFSKFFSLLKLLRIHPAEPTRKIAQHYHFAWSNSETARLASEQIWGMPSELSKVEVTEDRKHFLVSANDQPLFEIHWRKKPKWPSPFGLNLHLFTVGQKTAEGQLWSDVKSCGSSKIGRFKEKKGDRITFHDSKLRALFEDLKFDPFLKETSRGARAVQFAPN